MHTVHKNNFYGTPQGTVLGPLIFRTFLCDLFYFLDGVTVASYADNILPYSVDKTKYLVIKELEHLYEFFLDGLTLTRLKSMLAKVIYFSQEMTVELLTSIIIHHI